MKAKVRYFVNVTGNIKVNCTITFNNKTLVSKINSSKKYILTCYIDLKT